MTTTEDPKATKPVLSPPPATPVVPPVDVERQAPAFGVSSIVRRWRREDLLKKGSLVLRAVGLLFSVLSFIIMASNRHGDWKNFDKYEEYRYLLCIALLATIYTAAQVIRQMHQFSSGKAMFSQHTSSLVDFFGDQVVAYLLISAASTAVPLTNRMREGSDNIFTDSTAASISMAFFAFVTLALSAMISGFKLANKNYI
ncbi:hypothetical protein GIB67_020270 [Kingdonia uniflora]|uniref:CASP-like protein n=1 Tax=Kingdonia uniflora TaxID=39325 RepID=A0A7J7P4J1_9MAGN|nr:hypothetical protein GIB67_020270 [Kingdonia uniflora]